MRKILMLMVVLIMTLSLVGCGDENLFESMADDSSAEAKVDAGIIALNDGDYAKAAAILADAYAEAPEDPEVRQLYADALVGEAGFDTLDLMVSIGEAADANTADSVGFDAAMESIFNVDMSAGWTDLDPDEIKATRLAIREGIDVLGTTESEEFSAGLYAVVEIALILEEVIGGVDPNTYVAPVGGTDVSPEHTAALTAAINDVIVARETLAAISGAGTDFGDELDSFIFDVAGADETIDAGEIDSFFSNL